MLLCCWVIVVSLTSLSNVVPFIFKGVPVLEISLPLDLSLVEGKFEGILCRSVIPHFQIRILHSGH
jgi:hypothetical protein